MTQSSALLHAPPDTEHVPAPTARSWPSAPSVQTVVGLTVGLSDGLSDGLAVVVDGDTVGEPVGADVGSLGD